MPFDALEYVVRPYQTPDAHGRIIIPSAPRGSLERATLTWRGASDVPQPQEVDEGVNYEVVCCQESLNELSRESETERVYQNGDEASSNWVDVARPLSLKLKKKDSNKCGDDWNQISSVAQEISAALAEFEAAIHSGINARPKTCSVGWSFKNQ